MAIDKNQRAFFVGSAIEFVGIVAIAYRFGANRGGTALLVGSVVLLAIGLGIQVRAMIEARRARR